MNNHPSGDDHFALAAHHDNAVGLLSTDRAGREEILHRAYEIWEREGHPADRKLDNWLEAEAEFKSGVYPERIAG